MAKPYIMKPGDRIIRARSWYDEAGELHVETEPHCLTADGRRIRWGRFRSQPRPKKTRGKRAPKAKR